MTDKEIAHALRAARWWPNMFKGHAVFSTTSYHEAKRSAHIIHHIINSINWETLTCHG